VVEFEVRIGSPGPDDLDEIADLHTRSRTEYHRGFVPEQTLTDPAHAARHREAFDHYLRSADHTFRCAWTGELLAGFALIGPTSFADPDPRVTSELHSLYVDPDRFRQGIGTRLHDACVRALQVLPATGARLWVMDYNERARAFYARQGWEFDGHHRPDNPALLGYRLNISGRRRS
jgi:ribosomal protein S18 acetylase RimI-like enzyme